MVKIRTIPIPRHTHTSEGICAIGILLMRLSYGLGPYGINRLQQELKHSLNIFYKDTRELNRVNAHILFCKSCSTHMCGLGKPPYPSDTLIIVLDAIWKHIGTPAVRTPVPAASIQATA
jgi:hypothetical protein